IWWLPAWGDWLWIGFWSISSGLIIILKPNYLYRSLATAGCVIVLAGVCWLILNYGGWLALVPGTIAIALTATGIWIYETYFFRVKTSIS
ncbi:MAG: hypothetical protein ACRC80_26905, partial [Waterburya sp.]